MTDSISASHLTDKINLCCYKLHGWEALGGAAPGIIRVPRIQIILDQCSKGQLMGRKPAKNLSHWTCVTHGLFLALMKHFKKKEDAYWRYLPIYPCLAWNKAPTVLGSFVNLMYKYKIKHQRLKK